MRRIHFLVIALTIGMSLTGTLLMPRSSSSAPTPGAAPFVQCQDPWITQAIQELVGRDPRGSATTGECDIKRYGHGQWSDYNDLKNKVREGFFNHSDEARIKAERCFGGVGPKCEGLPGGLSKHVNGNGTVTLFVSVGSIMHDNCCLAYPEGKMCHGNNDDNSGRCIKEWDKAWWNSIDGRAWPVTFDPNAAPDLTVVKYPRTAQFRLGGTNMTPGYAMFETNATGYLSAPRGQALDPGDQAFCGSGQADARSGFGKNWIVCR